LVLRVGFAGKRQLDAAQTETVRTRLRDVFSVLGWRLVEISPLDDATNERPVPAIARFYSHKRPTLRLIHGLCEGAWVFLGVIGGTGLPAAGAEGAAVFAGLDGDVDELLGALGHWNGTDEKALDRAQFAE
jgi:hypothetical protein